MIYEGSKKTDLTKVAKDSASPVINYTVLNSGQALIEMNRSAEYNDASRDNFADFLTSQGLDKMADKVRNANQFRIRQKITRYMKTLLSVEDHDGSLYGKVLNDDLYLFVLLLFDIS